MGKFDRVKKRTKYTKIRKGFSGVPAWNKCVNNVDSADSSNNSVETVDIVNNVNNECNDSNNGEIDISAIDNTNSSISSRKLEQIVVSTPKKERKIEGNRIIDTEILSSVFSQVLCPRCRCCETLHLGDNTAKKQGLCSQLYIECSNCDYFYDFHTSRKSGKAFDINKRSVYTFRALGQGHSGLKKFTALMNMPKPMAANNYDKLVSAISAVTKTVAVETMKDGVEQIREAANAKIDSVIDTAVSCDGSWQKRGYASLNGVVTIISLDNGKIIDIEPMSKNCKACCLKEPLKHSDPVSYANWRNSHICSFNYKGSAPGMEPEGAKCIFERSIEKNKLRYTEYLGDGDSKSYSIVKNIYDNLEITKLECVGHYQKRVGTRLRRLKKATKDMGGQGRLTDAMIDRLQNFFDMAIRQNAGNLEGMQAATRAVLFHVASSAKNNWHFPHCPTGGDSWCRYYRDKVNNTTTYKPGPGLPLDIVFKIRPIFQELSSEENLKKCLHGRTQNQNESFNATIWERIPKSNYISLAQLEFGVYDAVANFNIGRKASVLIYEQLDMIPGVSTLDGCNYLNSKRLSRSTYKNTDSNKLRRKILRGKKLQKADKDLEVEGELYIPGGC